VSLSTLLSPLYVNFSEVSDFSDFLIFIWSFKEMTRIGCYTGEKSARRHRIDCVPMWYPLGKPSGPGMFHLLKGAYGEFATPVSILSDHALAHHRSAQHRVEQPR